MQAIILAGGFGTRLSSVISTLPKPMAPIGNKPFLSILIDYLLTQGISKIILSLHHKHEDIQSYFQSEYKNIELDYAIEKEPLGTGGAILHSLQLIKNSEPVFVVNGDTLLKLNYQLMWQQHQSNSPLMTMALRKIPDGRRYGVVELTENRVTSFVAQGENKVSYINGGVYLLTPALFEIANLPKHFSFEKDFLDKYTKQISAEGFITEDYFIDIGVPQDYYLALKEL